MIQARIKKTFPPRQDSSAYSLDLEFQARAGITVLFGPSGAGKTLVLDCIAGFVKPEDGRIMLDDSILFDAAAGVHLPPQGRQCGYVFQNYALFPHMTLRENLQFAAERSPRLERHRRVNDMLERFRLADAAGRRPHELSGGQKQRCSIARALIGSPKLLLLDEPAQGLDAALRGELYDALRQVRSDFGTPVLLVTHDLEECFELGEELIILRDGEIAQSDTPRAILDQPASADVARLLGVFNLLPAVVTTLDPGRNTSRIEVGEPGEPVFDLEGPYFPGRLKGDRVTLCVRTDLMGAVPAMGRPGPNQIGMKCQRVADRPQGVRLEFAHHIAVDLPRTQFEKNKDTESWFVEFPAAALRAL